MNSNKRLAKAVQKLVYSFFPQLEEEIMSKKRKQQQQQLLLVSPPSPRPRHKLSQLFAAIEVNHFIVWRADGSYERRDIQEIDYLVSARRRTIQPIESLASTSKMPPFRLEYEVTPVDYQNPSAKGPDGTRYTFLAAHEDWGVVFVQTRVEQRGTSEVKEISVADLFTLLGKYHPSNDTALSP